MTDDLIIWLTAQIDEDERIAKAATPGPWRAANVTNYPAHMGQSATLDGPDIVKDRGIDPHTGLYKETLQPVVVIPPDIDSGPCVDLADVEHMVRQDPPRALREVAAKRSHIDRWRHIGELVADTHEGAIRTELLSVRRACWLILTDDAAVYADRPGYREVWQTNL